jgi:hypothetical protein
MANKTQNTQNKKDRVKKILRGKGVQSIAEEFKCTPSHVSSILRGDRVNEDILQKCYEKAAEISKEQKEKRKKLKKIKL